MDDLDVHDFYKVSKFTELFFNLFRTKKSGRKLENLSKSYTSKEPFICFSNLKIHLAIRASSTETAAPALL